tara:strand:+ start:6326 stop:6454 length:129 start_codon:yes stop_codon:yes gene_type:complete
VASTFAKEDEGGGEKKGEGEKGESEKGDKVDHAKRLREVMQI